VRPFEASQFRHKEFVWDALGAIDSRLPEQLRKAGAVPARVNESVPEHALRVIEAVRSAPFAPATRQQIVALVLKDASAMDERKPGKRAWDGRIFALPAHLRKNLVAQFAEDYRYVARRYMGAKDGILFRDPVV